MVKNRTTHRQKLRDARKRTSRKEPRDRLFGVNSGTHRRAVRLADYYMSHISALLLLPSELAYQGFQDALIDVAIAIAKEMAYLLAPIILVAALIAIFLTWDSLVFF